MRRGAGLGALLLSLWLTMPPQAQAQSSILTPIHRSDLTFTPIGTNTAYPGGMGAPFSVVSQQQQPTMLGTLASAASTAASTVISLPVRVASAIISPVPVRRRPPPGQH
jgi:hypothetical protein